MLTLKFLSSPCRAQLSRNLPAALVRLCHTKATDEFQKAPQVVVYEGNLRSKLRLLKLLSLGTTALAFCSQPAIFEKVSANHLGGTGMALMAAFLLFTTASPFVLHVCSKGYVTELRFEPQAKTFEADTFTFFAKTTTTSFSQADVSFPELLGPLSTLKIKNKAYLIDFDRIIDADAFDCIMKYDKPIDLMLETEPSKDAL